MVGAVALNRLPYLNPRAIEGNDPYRLLKPRNTRKGSAF